MLYLITALLYATGIQAGEWWSLPRTEDSQYIYYVGVADGRKEKFSLLQEQATNKAMSEIVREHFGVNVQISETSVEELKGDSFQVVSKQISDPLFIKGTALVKTFERLVGETTRVYVQIRVEKKKLSESIEKKHLSQVNEQLNTYGEHHASLVNFKVKTNPSGALINLSHIDKRFAIQGQGDAIFNLPRGRYKMVITMSGYLDETREVLIQSDGREELIILEKLHSLLDLDIRPDDALVKINGVQTDERGLQMTVGAIMKINVSHPDYLSQEVEVISHAPEELSRTIILEPKKSTLRFELEPREADVRIDYQSIQTYQGKTQVVAGQRRITVSHAGFEDYSEVMDVQPNREYPLKVIRLKKMKRIPKAKVAKEQEVYTPRKQFEIPSESGRVFRFEYNPVSVIGSLGRVHLLPVAFHVEWYYISLGVGLNFTSKKEPENENNDQEEKMKEKDYSDLYSTMRLITPRLGDFKFFASGTLGETTEKVKTFDQEEGTVKSKSYMGVGGGFRWYISPKWSAQAEYFNIQSVEKETKRKTQETRLILGVGYEF